MPQPRPHLGTEHDSHRPLLTATVDVCDPAATPRGAPVDLTRHQLDFTYTVIVAPWQALGAVAPIAKAPNAEIMVVCDAAADHPVDEVVNVNAAAATVQPAVTWVESIANPPVPWLVSSAMELIVTLDAFGLVTATATSPVLPGRSFVPPVPAASVTATWPLLELAVLEPVPVARQYADATLAAPTSRMATPIPAHTIVARRDKTDR